MRALEKYIVPAPVHRRLPPPACATSPSSAAAPSRPPSSPRSRTSLPTPPVRSCFPSHRSSAARRCPTQSSPASNPAAPRRPCRGVHRSGTERVRRARVDDARRIQSGSWQTTTLALLVTWMPPNSQRRRSLRLTRSILSARRGRSMRVRGRDASCNTTSGGRAAPRGHGQGARENRLGGGTRILDEHRSVAETVMHGRTQIPTQNLNII
jgi:hypothetical protein